MASMDEGPAEILVCHSRTCLSAGSEAVLLEIEELARGVGASCTVEASGCLGNCSQAPNALIIKKGQRDKLCPRIRDEATSAVVVETATGKKPDFSNAHLRQRISVAGQKRIRVEAAKEKKWNAALAGLEELVNSASDAHRLELQMELAGLLSSAALWEDSLAVLSDVEATAPTNIKNVLMERSKVLGKLGWSDEIDLIEKRFQSDGIDVSAVLRSHRRLAAESTVPDMITSESHRRIEGYALWRLENVSKISKHTALYHFRTEDKLKGSPNQKGRGRKVAPVLWHTTMLARVGGNQEGPLQWIERDYTPVSSWRDWEQGRCDLLVKIFKAKGTATSWLHEQPLGQLVWLATPTKTLQVPSLSLVPDIGEAGSFGPASVLLLLGGTGVVIASQVLQHTHPLTCFGMRPDITASVSVVYSCRKDDFQLSNEMLSGLCKYESLKSFTVLLTDGAHSPNPPFPDQAEEFDPTRFNDGANREKLRWEHSRLNQEVLKGQVEALRYPFKIVVSGPAGFNTAVRQVLDQIGIPRGAVTILSA